MHARFRQFESSNSFMIFFRYKDSKKVFDIDDLKSRVNQKWDKNANILSVDKATDNDAGNYSCVAYQGSNEKARANITLAVTSKSCSK